MLMTLLSRLWDGVKVDFKPECLSQEFDMHEILVALAFVAMVACPAFVASMPMDDMEDEA